MMRKSTIGMNLLLWLFAGALLAQPQMTVPVDSLDFGYAPQGYKINCRFWLYSSGHDTLKIANVRTSCGCTQAPLDKRIVAPGDSTPVEIIFNTGSYRGKVTKMAYISTNAGTEEKKVTITTEVLPSADSTFPVVITPSALDLAQWVGKKSGEMKFQIKNVSTSELEPQLITSSLDMFKVKLPKRLKPGESAEGEVVLTSDVPSTPVSKSFTFTLNDVPKSRFTVPVNSGSIVHPSTPSPAPTNH
jgi:hypothetical protein